MGKDSTIRVGDRVKILRPNIIYKWGYDNNLQDTAEEVLQSKKKEIEDFIKAMVNTPIPPVFQSLSSWFDRQVSRKAITRVAKGIAYELVSRRMRDGQVRKLFYRKYGEHDWYHPLDHKEDQIAEVSAIKIVKTGVYFGPSYDYENGYRSMDHPGGLRDVKTHKLLELNWTDDWIEDCDVERVENVES